MIDIDNNELFFYGVFASLAIGLAYIYPSLKVAFVQKSYAISGVINRHKPYDSSVWDEQDPQTLLWKVGPIIGRSGSAIMSLFNLEMARTSLLGYIVFRAQDTWADVCIGHEERIAGLDLIPKRLKKLYDGETEVPADDTSMYKWDFETRERNRLYVDVTRNAHRFDEVFLSLTREHQHIILKYATELGDGWAELERQHDAPVTPELMRKHAEVALDCGAFGLCRAAGANDLIDAVDPASGKTDPKSSAAYIAFSDFIWYLNLAVTIEDDVAEGVSLDPELRAMKGMDTEVIERVRIKWLVIALEQLANSGPFLFHSLLMENYTSRLFILQFLKISIQCCEKYLPDPPKKKSAPKALIETLQDSWSKKGYEKATEVAMNTGDRMLVQFKAVKTS